VQLNRGAVVTASIGEPSGKPRPFVVLRSGHFGKHALVTILAFTGTMIEAPSLRVTVQPSSRNGLRAPSQAMIDHIQSVRVQRVSEVIGHLAEADMRAITRGIAVYLGLADASQRRGVHRVGGRRRVASPPRAP